MLAKNEISHRRFALAVVANLEVALTITQHLIRSDLEPQIISIIGQEANFAGERHSAIELARILSRSTKIPALMVDSNEIISLGRDTHALPKAIARNSEACRAPNQRSCLRRVPAPYRAAQHGRRAHCNENIAAQLSRIR